MVKCNIKAILYLPATTLNWFKLEVTEVFCDEDKEKELGRVSRKDWVIMIKRGGVVFQNMQRDWLQICYCPFLPLLVCKFLPKKTSVAISLDKYQFLYEQGDDEDNGISIAVVFQTVQKEWGSD